MSQCNIKDIELKITDIRFWDVIDGHGMKIYYTSGVGSGEYDIFYKPGEGWKCYSETLQTDKAFVRELLKLTDKFLLEKIKIVSGSYNK